MKIRIEWNFDDTGFEGLQYSEAVSLNSLPTTISLDELDEDDDVESYLYENYSFWPSSWEED